MKITSDHIHSLLRDKHAADVYVSECKSGPTHYTNHLRMDAWTMEKSWANPCVTAYEIKVTRADFMQDKKLHLYLPFCNQLYIAAPAKMIDKNEVPADCGLIEAYENVMRVKKKAPYRDVVVPEDVYRYILMCRIKIRSERHYYPEQRHVEAGSIDYWRLWLKEKDENKEIGRNVSKKIMELVNKRITEVEIDNHRLTKINENLENVKKRMIEMGLNPDSTYDDSSAVERKIKAVEEAIPYNMVMAAENLKHSLEVFIKARTRATTRSKDPSSPDR